MSDFLTLEHHVILHASPERVWAALTDGEQTRRYYYGTRFVSDLQPGSSYAYLQPDGQPMLDGEILAIDPPRRLVMSFRPRWKGEEGEKNISRVTLTLYQEGEQTTLAMVHDGLDAGSNVGGGWPKILASLQRMLEAELVPAAAT